MITDAEGRTLVIVESPAKAKTINKYLGDDYLVTASMGHIRDLPRKEIGIQLDKKFKPTYQVLADKKDIVTGLRKLAKTAREIYYACDPDREGEAIAWHLSQILRAKKPSQRVTFNEITKTAVAKALDNPRDIDMPKVNAQQARRILDRIVGYKLSPLLWRKVRTRLSAGRVQSVAVKILVERERLIRAFVSTDFWRLNAVFAAEKAKEENDFSAVIHSQPLAAQPAPEHPGKEENSFSAVIHSLGEQKLDPKGFYIDTAQRAQAIYERLKEGPCQVTRYDQKIKADKPAPPFITSTLQQSASTRLGFSTKRTMVLAQQLYEGIDLKGDAGRVGLITYMRTDSFNLAEESVEAARKLIRETFGDDFLPESPTIFKTKKKGAQEAHEAIRPTLPHMRPEDLEKRLSADQLKLYRLIWQRFIGCQMTAAKYNHTTIEVTITPNPSKPKPSELDGPHGHDANFDAPAVFRTTGKTLVFAGHARVTGLKLKANEQLLPLLKQDQPVDLHELNTSEHQTQPPPRYNEASLVKTLEEYGIGRPSTYSAIVQTIQARGYVKQESRKLFATALGEVVTDKLQGHFQNIMDTDFTASMEASLDEVEHSKADWVKLLDQFYQSFEKNLEEAKKSMKAVNEEPPKAGVKCEKCHAEMVIMYNKLDMSRFIGCSKYPECSYTMSMEGEAGSGVLQLEEEVECPLCGQPLQLRRSRFGQFLGCTGYPKCKGKLRLKVVDGKLTPLSPDETPNPVTDIKCEKCGQFMVVRRSKRGSFLGCSGYPDCHSTAQLPEELKIGKKGEKQANAEKDQKKADGEKKEVAESS